MEQYKSLYEYLGRAAGKEGRAVYDAAKAKGIETTAHEVSNPKYSGLILRYPVSFLDEYFNSDVEPTLGDIQDNELPF